MCDINMYKKKATYVGDRTCPTLVIYPIFYITFNYPKKTHTEAIRVGSEPTQFIFGVVMFLKCYRKNWFLTQGHAITGVSVSSCIRLLIKMIVLIKRWNWSSCVSVGTCHLDHEGRRGEFVKVWSKWSFHKKEKTVKCIIISERQLSRTLLIFSIRFFLWKSSRSFGFTKNHDAFAEGVHSGRRACVSCFLRFRVSAKPRLLQMLPSHGSRCQTNPGLLTRRSTWRIQADWRPEAWVRWQPADFFTNHHQKIAAEGASWECFRHCSSWWVHNWKQPALGNHGEECPWKERQPKDNFHQKQPSFGGHPLWGLQSVSSTSVSY